jgi:hypothetical protein
MTEVGIAEDAQTAYTSIKTMIGNLGDPFTRLATPQVSFYVTSFLSVVTWLCVERKNNPRVKCPVLLQTLVPVLNCCSILVPLTRTE